MTVLEILKNASYYLNLDVEFAPYFEDLPDVTPTQETQREWEKMLRAFNFLLKSIATGRIALIAEEEIVFNSMGEFSLSALSQKFHDVQRIVGYNGLVFASKTNDGKLKSSYVGPAMMKYSYVPEDFEASDEMQLFDGVIDDLVFAYGVCYVYCEMSSLFDDAFMWKEKFEDAINDCMRQGLKQKIVRARRWLD